MSILTILFLKISFIVVEKDFSFFTNEDALIFGTNKNTQKAKINPQLAASGNFVTPKTCVIDEEIIGPREYPIVPAAMKILMFFARFSPLYRTTNPVACG